MKRRVVSVALLTGSALLGACSNGSSSSITASASVATSSNQDAADPRSSIPSNDQGGATLGGHEREVASTTLTDTDSTDSRLTELAGLWNVTRDVADGNDIRYLLIRDDGIITDYDYARDATGSGANCYAITSYRLNAEGDDRFSVGNRSLNIMRIDDTLDYRFADVDDEDGDSDSDEELAFEFPLLDGIDPADLTSCGI